MKPAMRFYTTSSAAYDRLLKSFKNFARLDKNDFRAIEFAQRSIMQFLNPPKGYNA
jgi:hypothetical protein